MCSLITGLLALNLLASPPIRTETVHPQVLSGLEIQIEGERLVVGAGVCRVAGELVRTTAPAVLPIVPVEPIAVTDERLVLGDQPAHPSKCMVNGRAAPGSLVAEFVRVRLADGTELHHDIDFRVDEEAAAIHRSDAGRIARGQEVLISYRVEQMRIDAIEVGSGGAVSVSRGTAALCAPEIPQTPARTTRLAHVLMLSGVERVEPWQVYVVGDRFPEPGIHGRAIRGALVSKTLTKLRRGQPVTIIAWGDDVMGGAGASSSQAAFVNLLVSGLQERFGDAKIRLVDASVAETDSTRRLGDVHRDVMAHRPDLVLVIFQNDVELAAETLRENYAQTFASMRAMGAEIIMMTPHLTRAATSDAERFRGSDQRANVQVLREIAQQHLVALADVARRWEHLQREGIPNIALLADGDRLPDDRGHEIYLRELMTFFPEEDEI